MILILTYHKVTDRAGQGETEFYTISGWQLARQIELLQARHLECLRMEDLLQTQTAPDNKFILSFDDATADHFEVVFPILQKSRCQGVFAVPTAKLDKPGYLTRAQVGELAAAGHVIASHSHEHQRLDILPDEEIRRQIARSQEIIADLTGAQPLVFVPPGGFTNDRVRRVAASLGVCAQRTMRWGYNLKLDLMALETIPVNHYNTEQKFIQLLEPRGPSLLYAGKEALKRWVPMHSYERLRNLAFKFRNSK